MKKMLINCFFIMLCISVQAQTKEETEKFISKCMNEAIGLKAYGVLKDGKVIEERLYEENTFQAKSITTFLANKDYEEGTYKNRTYYTKLNWENVLSVEISQEYFHKNDEGVHLLVKFSTNIKFENSCVSGSQNRSCTQTFYGTSFWIFIPKNRAEACKKAFLHLVKIYKEENKDPF